MKWFRRTKYIDSIYNIEYYACNHLFIIKKEQNYISFYVYTSCSHEALDRYSKSILYLGNSIHQINYIPCGNKETWIIRTYEESVPPLLT